MKLLSHRLANFKGIKTFTLDTQGGKDVSIYADNGVGKTTLADAFHWLLFDKDSQDKKDFSIKTLDANNNPIPGLNHEVEGVLELDGKELTLKKIYKEVWTKKRGSAQATFTGHTTDHFIDGVPVPKKDYLAKIDEIVNEDIFKLLTNPRYFNDMLHWKKRRQILLDICGDVSDSEILATLGGKDQMLALTNILNTRSLDDHRKIVRSRMTEINKQLQQIPVRISEAERAIPDTSDLVSDALEIDTKVLLNTIQKKNEELARISAGGEVAEKMKALAEVEAEIVRQRMQANEKRSEMIRQLQEQLEKKRSESFTWKGDIECLSGTNRERARTINCLEEQMKRLREEWQEINAVAPEQGDICPTCEQPLPAEQIEQALAEFNRKKAERLESINAQGKELKEQAAQCQAEIKKAEQTISEYKEKLKAEKITMDAIEKKIDALRQEAENLRDDPELMLKKTALEQEIRSIQSGSDEAREQVQTDIAELNKMLSDLEASREKLKMKEQLTARIKELQDEERELAAEYEQLEQEQYLMDEYTRAKVRLLEEKINSFFKLARFKMFEMLVNGGIEECCETMHGGVPWSTGLNNGAQINVGIDIINTLSEFYGFNAPIFVDNAESVTEIIPTKTQLIRLIVSEQDKELRVEIEGKKEKGVA